ncbi:carbonyl reductase [Listeria newyorkensis]|uniref:Carbonyl reductase n=1 Tax=Listeria newyorkensis TaxID=1497681 RepID=A0ABX4XIS7_9LIST|nr:SDR family NAD(P)-dependent oxidoreductase [Listeria newyorkensis]KGL37883.1 carbonyl reductase [Listeria newyorkensis]PNP88393.1 carbonyl reductase [Listeria newyorkensis]WAO20495.1 SDR family NAD(P)-dependent oxidoreductase [Listeria newyorkensis]SQC56676.1 3-oxoacyl-[acyl-carrier-protein] reductase FabG [Listeria newyorkensis]
MTKKVFITGANKGIGKEIAYQMGENGWTILLGARDASRGLAATDELKTKGIDATYVNIDLQNHETISAAVNTIKSEHPDLAMLINNAAIPGDMRKPGSEFTVNELREVMETNVFGTFDLTQQLLPTLEANNGRILNITIPIGMSDFFNPFAYKTSKAALNAMMQSFAQNFITAEKSLEIFGIMPGGVTTDLNGNMTGDFMKTVPEAGKLITDIIFDGKNHNSEIINFNGKTADYNGGLF